MVCVVVSAVSCVWFKKGKFVVGLVMVVSHFVVWGTVCVFVCVCVTVCFCGLGDSVCVSKARIENVESKFQNKNKNKLMGRQVSCSHHTFCFPYS
jgi:hypothetical protein